ncbi:MAG: ATP-binding protein, partial [Saprospiraceae bacterium]|nr:ATP-binding protein [Saprospiraceae bacterium]
LHARIAGAGTRAELLAILEPRRIIVGTVAAFANNDKLLEIKKIQRLIVDEASQILEPQLLGLLTRFEHFVLIGDHQQLPAVTAQAPEHTRVGDPDLQAIGLTDLRDSYFERLYRLCVERGMYAHYGQLFRQGRMHAEIMDFPNRHFYGGRLQTLASEAEVSKHYQHLPLPVAPLFYPEKDSPGITLGRVAFLPVSETGALPNQKTALAEARLAAQLLRYFQEQYAAQGKTWGPETSLGIISPWRAQIAQIRQAIAEAGLDPDALAIDTVERYQGGAREVILISCCVHSAGQLERLVSLSAEGVDRKLNVALTRAREQLIVLGNPEALGHDARYRAFMEAYGMQI